jgi:hypothetical protein
MKMSKRIKEETDYVTCALGIGVICRRCDATLVTYADQCTADLSDSCPGFLAIEGAKERFRAARELLEAGK